MNAARLRDCRGPEARLALRDEAKLTLAASHWATGRSLQAALAAAGYLAARSSAVHLSGAVGDADVERILAATYCDSLTPATLHDLGSLRRGREVWLIIAASAAVPSERDAAAIAGRMLASVNEARAHGRHCGTRFFAAVPSLTLNTALTHAAREHSRDMAATGRFDHGGSGGSSPAMRIVRAGYGGFAVVGENIAAGVMTPADVVQGWLDSPAHCENIMDPRFVDMGSGFAVNSSRSEGVYWTQDFALARPPAPRGRAVNP